MIPRFEAATEMRTYEVKITDTRDEQPATRSFRAATHAHAVALAADIMPGRRRELWQRQQLVAVFPVENIR